MFGQCEQSVPIIGAQIVTEEFKAIQVANATAALYPSGLQITKESWEPGIDYDQLSFWEGAGGDR